ncbi:LacI family DNA-binding transcriptional regulator, partial [Nonomuraea jabiensis]|uniref:LacI family DNA-binding transcriptional regulator n=1 Tax=Nonomuraea jabiensis TaxID=882448 RepID=UPI003414D5E0
MSSIKEVARLAGVSVGTVSNVLNRPDMVAPDTRLRVRAAIARLGYVRNGSARQLRAGHSRTIGVVALDLANPFFIDVGGGGGGPPPPPPRPRGGGENKKNPAPEGGRGAKLEEHPP